MKLLIIFLLSFHSKAFSSEWVWYEQGTYWDYQEQNQAEKAVLQKKEKETLPKSQNDDDKGLMWKDALNPKNDLFYDKETITKFVLKNRTPKNIKMYQKWVKKNAQWSSSFLKAISTSSEIPKKQNRLKGIRNKNLVVKVFYSKTCSACVGALKVLKELRRNFRLEMINVSLSDFVNKKKDRFHIGDLNRKARENELLPLRISATPTLFILNPKTKVKVRLDGMPSKEDFIKHMEAI